MTIEQLKRAKEIEEAIKIANRELTVWEGATHFEERVRVRSTPSNSQSCGGYNVDSSTNSFAVMKALNVEYYRANIAALEKEFQSL